MQLCLLVILFPAALCSLLGFQSRLRHMARPSQSRWCRKSLSERWDRWRRYSSTSCYRYSNPLIKPSPLFIKHVPPTIERELISGRRKVVIDFNVIMPFFNDDYLELRIRHREAELAYFEKNFSSEPVYIEDKMLDYKIKYGSAANGFVVEMGMDPHDYEEALVKGIDYDYIKYDQTLVNVLKDLDADIIISADANLKHVKKALTKLGIMPFVHAIFASIPGEVGLPLKSSSTLAAFDRIESFLGVTPDSIIYIDDSNLHLQLAKELGSIPIRISRGRFPSPISRVLDDCPAILTIHDLSEAFQKLGITSEEE